MDTRHWLETIDSIYQLYNSYVFEGIFSQKADLSVLWLDSVDRSLQYVVVPNLLTYLLHIKPFAPVFDGFDRVSYMYLPTYLLTIFLK